MEKILNEEIVLVQDLEDTRRGTKGFGSSDRELTKQTGAGADLLSKPPPQKQQSSLSESLLQNDRQKMPRPHMMTKQSGAGAGLLNKQSCEVTGPPGHSSPQNGKIQISEITQKEFRRAYKNGETTGVLKFSQKEKQIYLRKINISTELAIRNREERRIKNRTEEDALENLVPEEYHDMLQAFEKGEKTGLPPHRPGIDLEINMEEGKGLPDQKIYPLGAEELETVQEYINKNEARGWIREAFTDGGSPIMFVKKKDGSLRLCVDYRALNEVTKKDRYPLPLIGEALDRLHTAKYFTKLDIKEAYHNVRIKKGDEWKTTFTSKYGTYEYLVMPFGLCNAPATFQRWINRTLQRFIDRCCIVYLDDVLIYSDKLEQHKRDV